MWLFVCFGPRRATFSMRRYCHHIAELVVIVSLGLRNLKVSRSPGSLELDRALACLLLSRFRFTFSSLLPYLTSCFFLHLIVYTVPVRSDAPPCTGASSYLARIPLAHLVVISIAQLPYTSISLALPFRALTAFPLVQYY